MSVLARNRAVSELEFYKNGKEIRAELTRFLMNEKHVPKRYSFVFRYPGIDLVRELMEEITAANTIFVKPSDKVAKSEIVEHNRNVTIRRHHQLKAIIKCEQIIQHLQWMIDTLDNVTVSRLETLAEKVINEVTYLKGWREKFNVIDSEKN